MNKLNEISIKQYLAVMNIHPVKDYGYYGMYHSPYREDNKASFKVDYNKNIWRDYGTNEGSSLIDLVMKMENCTFHEAANKLENDYSYLPTNSRLFSNVNNPIDNYSNILTFQCSNSDFSSFHGKNPSMTIQNIIPITHPKLIAWIQERRISLDLANKYCREIHYRNSNDKEYFSVGVKNDGGGYALSSPPDFKRCISHQNITTYRNNAAACLVFEGFWDFLSYLTIQKIEKTKHDVAVLNSVANVQKAIDFLKSHKEIYTYLDNDDAGRKATELIQSIHPIVYNRSTYYAEHNDLNDYLCGKKLAVKPEVQTKKTGIKI